MSAPSGHTGNGKEWSEQLLRDTQHGVYETTVEIHVGTHILKQLSMLHYQRTGQPFYHLVEREFLHFALFLCQLTGKFFQNDLTGIRKGIYGMSHTIDQTGTVEGFFIQDLLKISTDFLFVCPVVYISHDILKHFLHFQICATVFRTFQRTDGCRDRRICIRSRGSHHMVGKGRVITTAVFGMKHQSHIENSCLQFSILSVISQHKKNILRNGKSSFGITDQKCLILTEMTVGMIRINGNNRHLRDHLQRLAQYILYRNIFRIFIVGI